MLYCIINTFSTDINTNMIPPLPTPQPLLQLGPPCHISKPTLAPESKGLPPLPGPEDLWCRQTQ